ncbi:hypothetical protein PR048_021588 [Dryococelus australis]|uniref:Uncharacterized protein n=1 Tax=Dryococelus australis TaxID=614101 RepID=A0ABQ9GYN3_9NEOP|nr:hypothetical protein PR048_021588 [Dryococelus australis]
MFTAMQSRYMHLTTNTLRHRMNGHRVDIKQVAPQAAPHNQNFDFCYTTRMVKVLPPSNNNNPTATFKIFHLTLVCLLAARFTICQLPSNRLKCATTSHLNMMAKSGSYSVFFFLWRYIKDKVFRTPLSANIDNLKTIITDAIRTVIPDMLTRVWNEFEYSLNVVWAAPGRVRQRKFCAACCDSWREERSLVQCGHGLMEREKESSGMGVAGGWKEEGSKAVWAAWLRGGMTDSRWRVDCTKGEGGGAKKKCARDLFRGQTQLSKGLLDTKTALHLSPAPGWTATAKGIGIGTGIGKHGIGTTVSTRDILKYHCVHVWRYIFFSKRYFEGVLVQACCALLSQVPEEEISGKSRPRWDINEPHISDTRRRGPTPSYIGLVKYLQQSSSGVITLTNINNQQRSSGEGPMEGKQPVIGERVQSIRKHPHKDQNVVSRLGPHTSRPNLLSTLHASTIS